MERRLRKRTDGWGWVPTLYFAQGLPYVTVMTLAVLMYKRLGVGNGEIAFYTSWLYLPWVIKPLWSPVVDLFGTKLGWTVWMQILLCPAFAAIALVLPLPGFFTLSLAVFWFMAFLSATHDIASDGFYMLALDSHRQSVFVGIRATFYRIAMIVGQGALVVLAGVMEVRTGSVPKAWGITFGMLSLLFLLFAIYHSQMLPRPLQDRPTARVKDVRRLLGEAGNAFAGFFRRPGFGMALMFILLYRLPEAQLVKLITPFLVDSTELGGLGMSTAEVGFTYGVVGVVSLLVGGIIGGYAVSRQGLRRWMMPMAWSMSLTCLTFVYLSFATSPSMLTVNVCVAIEQFGYGFGTSAYMLYLLYYCRGENATSHYAIATGIMALGMMLPGMFAGKLQEMIGYQAFFLWTMVCCVATIAIASRLRIDPEFGRKGG